MDDFKPKLCRICLQSSAKFMSLFERLGKMRIHEHVMSVAMVNILPNDGLPDVICSTCLVELEKVITFRKKCEKSEQTLQQSHDNKAKVLEVSIKCEPEIISQLKEYKQEYEEIGADFIRTNESQEPMEYKSKLSLVPSPAKGQEFSPQCNECGQYFRSKCKMRVHWKKEHWHTTFRHCENCKKIFRTKISYEHHNKAMKCSDLIKNADKIVIIGEGRGRIFQCKHCDYNSKRFIHLRTHLVVHMPGAKPFKCKICSKAFTQQGTLNTHMIAKHDPSKHPTCHVCGKTKQSNQAMYRHMKFHQVVPVKCQVCSKSYKNNLTLKTHMARHTNTKSYQCEKCPKTFYTVAELIAHRKIHQKVKCKYCDFECANKGFMNKHEVKHGVAQLIPCVQCGRFYESTKRLLKHLQGHHKPKLFQCTTCPKAYGRQYELTSHMKRKHNFVPQNKHETTNEFECKMCPKVYLNRSNLNVHIKEKHNFLFEKKVQAFTKAKVDKSIGDADILT